MSNEYASPDIIRKKLRIAKTSLYAAIFIVLIKTIATVLSGSLAVLSELFHSSIDLVACVATIVAVHYSAKPPDEDHNYGHEKIESLSALFQVLILVLMCAYLVYESIHRIMYPHEIHLNWFTFSVILLCIFIDYSRSRALMRVAKETKSQALEADALHFTSDILSSIVVLISMPFTYFSIFPLADPISAILVSVIIVLTTLKLSRRAIDSLMDRVPKGTQEHIRAEVAPIKGVEGIKNLRIRGTGSKLYVDMTVFISRTKMFSQTHEIMDSVERRIKEIVPNSDIVIHSEPVESKNETLNEKIRLIVNDAGFKCHDIFSHKIEQDIFSELHVEIQDTNDLITAHSKISELEKKIKDAIPIISSVKIHIDEPSEILFETVDITNISSEIIHITGTILKENKFVKNYSDIKVIRSHGKIRVSMNCVFGSENTFDEVHDLVTILESKIYLSLKERYSNLSNVMIHAEPNNSN